MSKKLSNKNYIAIADWMVNDYKLPTKDLLTYAIIYGFSQDGESVFSGSLDYLGSWLNMQGNHVIRQLKRLIDAGLIEKNKKSNGSRVWCEYKAIVKKGSARSNNYIFITPEMIELGLKDKELIVYALIAGFSKTGSDSAFTGTNAYIAKWLNIEKKNVSRYTQSLIKKGLIERLEENNQIKYYITSKKEGGPQNGNLDHPQNGSIPPQNGNMGILNLGDNILTINSNNILDVVVSDSMIDTNFDLEKCKKVNQESILRYGEAFKYSTEWKNKTFAAFKLLSEVVDNYSVKKIKIINSKFTDKQLAKLFEMAFEYEMDGQVGRTKPDDIKALISSKVSSFIKRYEEKQKTTV